MHVKKIYFKNKKLQNKINLNKDLFCNILAEPPQGKPIEKGNRILYFNVDDVSLDHYLLGADLRVYRKKKHHYQNQDDDDNYMLHVFLLTEKG